MEIWNDYLTTSGIPLHILCDGLKAQNKNKTKCFRLRTSLAMLLVPAALAEVPVDGGEGAGGFALNRPGADISALSIVLIGHDVVVLHWVKDHGPVESGEVAEVGVLLHAHSSTGDVHQVVKANLFHLQHLEQHKRIVEEEIITAHHCEVGK